MTTDAKIYGCPAYQDNCCGASAMWPEHGVSLRSETTPMAQKKKTPPKAAAARPTALKSTRTPVVAKSNAKAKPKAMPATSKPMQPAKSTAVSQPKSKASAKVTAAKSSAKIAKPQTFKAAPVKPAPAKAVVPAAAASGKPAIAKKPLMTAAQVVQAQAMKAQLAKAQPAKAQPAKAMAAAHAAAPAPAPKVLTQAAVAQPRPGIATPPRPASAMLPLPAAAAVPVRAMPAAVGKPTAPRLTAPAVPAAKQATAPQSAAALAAAAANKKPVSSRHGFKTNESVVYPAHGVGRIVGIEEQEIAGISLELFVIQFEKDKMTLRVPTSKLASVGMRKLAEEGVVKRAMETLKGKARIKRTMWSRRAQEYEAKINSGDLVAIAEVVRDLYRSEAQPEQSYSERQLYEAALDRMGREIAAVEKLDERGAMQRITEVLAKSAKGRRLAEEEAASASAEVKAA